MYTAAYLVVASLAAIEVLAAAVPRVTPNVTPRALQRFPTTRRDLPVLTVQRELGPLLSNLSTIIGPDSPNWDNATDRFNIYTRPDVEVVVFPGEEKDVSTIVGATEPPNTTLCFVKLTQNLICTGGVLQ